MEFKDAEQVQQICWEMRCGDWPRDVNRTRINDLMNGFPPYSEEEVRDNNININVNYLEGTRIAHDARMQAQQGILKPGVYFNAVTDAGPGSKRSEWQNAVTSAINKRMKKSLPYFENVRAKIANNILHGIAPSCWENNDGWLCDPLGVEDLLIPANTYVTFKNLPFFCILRSLTAPELIKMTRRSRVDKAWNRKLVKQCLSWIDRESMALLGSNWPEVWSPSKMQERVKGDGGYYMGDQVPTIDVFDFYYWSDTNKQEGWRRRMVLDDWSTPASQGHSYQFSHNSKLDFGRNQWLYNPEDRVVANNRNEIFTCTFADLSAVAPFRYHSVRSLGFLLYAVCHLQNRLRCEFSRSVFESLLMYFRVKDMDDAERVLKLELANKGFIDDSVQFIPQAERYQVPYQLVELGLKENSNLISSNAASFSQSSEMSRDRTQKTKFQVMAEVNAATTLVSSALMQFFTYQNVEFNEILRRFMNEHSKDVDIRQARKDMLKAGIPSKYLVPEAWTADSERTLGAGNKTLEMAQSEQLMQFRPLYDPEAQRKILRDVTLAITDDPARAKDYVPEQPHVSDSVHDTELAFGTLMMGGQVTPRPGLNAIEVVGRMLQLMQNKIQQMGEMGSPSEIVGIKSCAQYANGFIQILAQDKEQQGTARAMAQLLSKLMNLVRAMEQRQQEAMKKQAQNGQGDPAAMAKIQAIMMQAQVKTQNAKQSHAEKTAQRQLQFEQQMKQDAQRSAMELRKKAAEADIDLEHTRRAKALDLAGEEQKQRMRSTNEEE